MVSDMVITTTNVESPDVIDDYNVMISNIDHEIDVSDLVSVVNIEHKEEMFELFENHKSNNNDGFGS